MQVFFIIFWKFLYLFSFLSLLFIKMRPDFLHPCRLIDMKWAAFIAMSASDTIWSIFFKRQIVFPGQAVAKQSQIVILVYERNIDPSRTWHTMRAIHTCSCKAFRRKAADHPKAACRRQTPSLPWCRLLPFCTGGTVPSAFSLRHPNTPPNHNRMPDWSKTSGHPGFPCPAPCWPGRHDGSKVQYGARSLFFFRSMI